MKIFFYLLILFNSILYAQVEEIDLIISIDEKVPTNFLEIETIRIVKKTGDYTSLDDFSFHQGGLILKSKDLNLMNSENVKYIYILLKYREYCGQDHKDYNYEIEFKPYLLEHEYLILKIFNTSKKRYDKIYYPISKEKKYTYDFDYSGPLNESLIQKRYKKSQKRCLKKS